MMHTHSYREPSPFSGQRVVVVGASASGEDISREIARLAKKAWLFAPACQSLSANGFKSMQRPVTCSFRPMSSKRGEGW